MTTEAELQEFIDNYISKTHNLENLAHELCRKFLWYSVLPESREDYAKEFINPTEFREFGFLQEVNRIFFHPLGLAMTIGECKHEDHSPEICPWPFGFWLGVYDWRSEPEGTFYDLKDFEENKEDYQTKALNVANFFLEKLSTRLNYAKEHDINVDQEGIQQVI